MIYIYTDGVCKGNTLVGGWGAVILDGQDKKEMCGFELNTTNNRMELLGVIKALATLDEGQELQIYTDSRYVQMGISHWIKKWKTNNWLTSDKKPVKNVDLWQQLDEESKRHHIQWLWVQGHSGDKWNERADRLANQGVENCYKEVKMYKSKSGFSLMEIMVVIGIIGILAIIAIPQYMQYVARAQVAEGLYALGHAKQVAIEYNSTEGSYPRTEELQELSNTKTIQLKDTKYLNLMTTNQSESNKYYEINLRFRNNGNINSNIRDKHLTFRLTYSTGQWDCISDDIQAQYLPAVCKPSIGNNSNQGNSGNNPNDYKDNFIGDGNAGGGSGSNK